MIAGRVKFIDDADPRYVPSTNRIAFHATLNDRLIIVEASVDTIWLAKSKADNSTRAGVPMTPVSVLEEAATRWFWKYGMPDVPGIEIGLSELYA